MRVRVRVRACVCVCVCEKRLRVFGYFFDFGTLYFFMAFFTFETQVSKCLKTDIEFSANLFMCSDII